MTGKAIIFALILVGAFGFFVFSVRRMIQLIAIGKPENRLDHISQRLKNLITVALGQSKLFRYFGSNR